MSTIKFNARMYHRTSDKATGQGHPTLMLMILAPIESVYKLMRLAICHS